MTYGRKLFDEEFALIKSHPAIGAHVLLRHSATAKYANIAKYHHLYYDGTNGYPMDVDLDSLKEKTFIHIVSVADCLDAATDTIGRNYKQGKTLEEFLEELRAGKGTRYSPDIVELFDDQDVVNDIRDLLTHEREDNYKKTYELLASKLED